MVLEKTKAATSEFITIPPRQWRGRYGRIPGSLSVFHLKHSEIHRGPWPCALMADDGDLGTFWAVKMPGLDKLVDAVRAGKRFFGHSGNGAFLINEFGQVLVPASDGDGRCAYVGRFISKLKFQNPFDNGIVDLSDDVGLSCGAAWRKPYVGCKYNWSFQHGIHFRNEDASGRSMAICPKQDKRLIAALRKVRAEGYIRFIVNPHGLVLTKQQSGSTWMPVYVGRIDYDEWFERED